MMETLCCEQFSKWCIWFEEVMLNDYACDCNCYIWSSSGANGHAFLSLMKIVIKNPRNRFESYLFLFKRFLFTHNLWVTSDTFTEHSRNCCISHRSILLQDKNADVSTLFSISRYCFSKKEIFFLKYDRQFSSIDCRKFSWCWWSRFSWRCQCLSWWNCCVHRNCWKSTGGCSFCGPWNF